MPRHLAGRCCLPVCLIPRPGLGDAWGQPSRAGPLDSVAKELGSHLLQVVGPPRGEKRRRHQRPWPARVGAPFRPHRPSLQGSLLKEPRADPQAAPRLQRSPEAAIGLRANSPQLPSEGRDCGWIPLNQPPINPTPGTLSSAPAPGLSSPRDLGRSAPLGVVQSSPTLLPSANFYGALALCQTLCQAPEPEKE